MKFRITALGEILYDIYPDMKRLGGAPFNFIYHVWKILGNAGFISSVGNDDFGMEIINHLKRIGFPTGHISISREHPTGTVLVTLDENRSPKFRMNGYNCFDYFVLDEKSRKLIEEKTDLLYFGTFGQRNETARRAIQSTFGKKLKYFCDLNLRHEFFTKEMVEESLRTSSVVKINETELDSLRKYFGLSSQIEESSVQLIEIFDLDLLSITLGPEGAFISDKNKTDYYKCDPVEPVDTLGAGDAYSALLAIGYLMQIDLKEINILANGFAKDICMVEGALPHDDDVYKKYSSLLLKQAE